MNLEQRQILFEKINKLEGLLAYAVKLGEIDEAERIRCELVQMIERL